MAQQNHNAAYLTVVDGITVWERLRVIRNFLTDRRTALKLAEMSQRKNSEKLSDPEVDKWEKEEIEIYQEQSEQLIKEAKAEIGFLEKLEAELAREAEKTRVDGKSDDEMYEINYFEELVQIQLLEVQSEMMAVGHISPNTMKTLIKNPYTMERVVELGILNEQILGLLKGSQTSQISLIGGTDYAQLAYHS